MALVEIKWDPPTRELRQFAWVWFPLVMAVVAFWIWRLTHQASLSALPLLPAIVAALLGWSYPAGVRPIYLTWMCLVYPIGWTISHLVLAGVYYLVMTPIGLVMRLFGYDGMQRRIDEAAPSYWSARPPVDDARRYFRQF